MYCPTLKEAKSIANNHVIKLQNDWIFRLLFATIVCFLTEPCKVCWMLLWMVYHVCINSKVDVNHEIVTKRTKRENFCRIWIVVPCNWKPVCYQWATLTPKAVMHLILFELVLLFYLLAFVENWIQMLKFLPFNLLYWHSAIWVIEFFENTKNEEMLIYWFSPAKSTCLFVFWIQINNSSL